MALTKLNTLSLADDAITSAKIADDAITSALIADNAVVTAAIADDAVTSAKTTVSAPNPNIIINGSMQVAQKPTLSHSGTDSAYSQVDRWAHEIRNVGTYTANQSTSVVPEGYSASLEIKCTSADTSLDANSYGHVTYQLEGQDVQGFKKGTSSAIAFALSFWVRSSKTGTYVVRIRDATNAKYLSRNYTISSANTWENKTIVFPADTAGAIANNTSRGLTLYFWHAAGTDYTSGSVESAWGQAAATTLAPSQVNLSDTVNATFYLTGVKLEAASAVTAYEHPDYSTEFTRSCRYFWAIRGDEGQDYSNNYGFLVQWSSSRFSGWNPFWNVHFPVQMRAIPTTTIVGTWGTSNAGSWSLSGYKTRMSAGMGLSGTTESSGAYAHFNSTDDAIHFDAEISL